jgi:hypothetical protein
MLEACAAVNIVGNVIATIVIESRKESLIKPRRTWYWQPRLDVLAGDEVLRSRYPARAGTGMDFR